MSLLGSLAGSRSLDSSILQKWGRGDDVGSSGTSLAGVSVTRETSLGLSAVWACTSLIADSIATLPRGIFSEDTDGTRTPSARPGWLDKPNPEQTWIDFVFGVVVSLLLDGNAFIFTVRDRMGEVAEAWCIDPRYVYVIREWYEGKLQIVYYMQVAQGTQSPLPAMRVPAGPSMFHIPAYVTGVNDPRGLSPLEINRQMLGGAIAGQEMGARFFGQGMNAGGVIEVPGDLPIEQARELKEDFTRANGGIRRMHLPPVLTGGASWKQISISPEQAQFLEHRQFSVEDIARFFRVPPYMVGSMTKTTTWGAGIEQQGIGFVTYTLRPWIERLEESFSRWTLMDRPKLKVGFNVDGLLRGDIKSRYDAYAVARQWGWMSANDVRLTEGDQPIGPDGDLYLTPINMAPPSKIDKTNPIPTVAGDPAPETTPAVSA